MVNTNEKFDVAIVGAGPAGSSAAIRLSAAGLKVLLVEKARFPREKLCGEFISPECLAHFSELGVIDEMLAASGTSLERTIFYGRRGNGVTVESSWFGTGEQAALGLSRSQMDLKLLERARQCGVDVRDGTSATAIVDGIAVSGLELRNDAGSCTTDSRIVLDATGRTRALARRFDEPSVKHAARFVAFKTHLSGARVSANTCEIYAYRGGYGGCNRVEKGLYDLCFIVPASEARRLGSDPERVMREVVFTNRRAAEVLKSALAAKPWLAVPIDSFGRGSLVPVDGLFTVGDSAAFIDPFTGSGMLLAFESAKIAATSIAESFRNGFDFHRCSNDYQKLYAATFDRRLRVCSLLRHAAFMPFLAEATISVLGLSDNLSRRVARATRLAGSER